MRKDPSSSYANHDGLVPFGKLVNYAGGRSNGCTSWSPTDAEQIIPLVKNNPTTLYIYPESRDIAAVARAKAAGQALSSAGPYWNASCLKEIGTPKFWPKKTLEPIIAQYKKDHPAPPQQPVLIATGTEDPIHDQSARLAALLPRGEFSDIPGRHHVNAPGARTFREAGLEFLAREV